MTAGDPGVNRDDVGSASLGSHAEAEPDLDPFPRERVSALLRRLPAYLRLATNLARDPRLPGWRRAAVIAGAAYVASPIDLVPGIVPVLGQLDDILVAVVALRAALAALDPAARARHLAAAGLTEADLAGDLATAAATTAWIARRGLHAGAVAVRAGARAGTRAAVAGSHAAARAGRVVADRGRAIAGRGTAAAATLIPWPKRPGSQTPTAPPDAGPQSTSPTTSSPGSPRWRPTGLRRAR